MRIAMLAPPWIPVPPAGYGGIEWVVSLLTDQLVEHGHEVTLFATGDSRSRAEVRAVFDRAEPHKMHQAMPYAMHVASAFHHLVAEAEAGRPYDVVHDHTAWLALAFAPLIPAPIVHTLHGAALDSERDFFLSVRDSARFVAISTFQAGRFGDLGLPVRDVVPNAVDVEAYPFRAEKDDYLLCLGRISRDKAQHVAIEAALRAEIPIVLAGKVDPGDDALYFDEAILPRVDGQHVRFEGEVPNERKRELFAGARAFLFPIQWDEPFGLVMIEAMASGTPVVATPRGAAPEVVVHGENGFLVHDVEGMVAALRRLDEIDPKRCRSYVQERFSPEVMAGSYERLYEDMLR